MRSMSNWIILVDCHYEPLLFERGLGTGKERNTTNMQGIEQQKRKIDDNIILLDYTVTVVCRLVHIQKLPLLRPSSGYVVVGNV